MIYETKNRRLILDNKERVELTEKEHEFLIEISSGNFTLISDIAKNIYGFNDDSEIANIRKIKSILCKKTNIEIANTKKGYILVSEIYFK